MRIKSLMVSIIFSFFFVSNSSADTIIMHNGERLSCIFSKYSQYATEVYAHGQKRILKTHGISSIETDDPTKMLLDSGEIIIGKLFYKNKITQINSEKFGIIQSPSSSISSISTTLDEKTIFARMNSTMTGTSGEKLQKVGEESKSPPNEFLRGSTVLRKPGEVELGVTLSYERSRYDNPVISTLIGVVANETRHRFMADLSTTIGITTRLEGWLNIPFQYANFDRTEGIYKNKSDGGGIGDISAGLRFFALAEGAQYPSIMLSFDTLAPTGKNPYNANFLDAAIAPGRGNWAVHPGIHFVNTSDPLTFFYGTSYQYEFSAKHYGTKYKRGDRIGYYGGVGFAVNDQASLSTRLAGEHIFEMEKDNTRQYGTSRDPVTLGLGLNYRNLDNIMINPFVNIGLNDDASDFILGLSISKSF